MLKQNIRSYRQDELVCWKGNHGNTRKPRSRLPGTSTKELAASAINKFTLDSRKLAAEYRFAGFLSFSGFESHLI
jgi:hypothetical protein